MTLGRVPVTAKIVAALPSIWTAGCTVSESPPESEYHPDEYDLWIDASAAPADGHIYPCDLAGHLALGSIPHATDSTLRAHGYDANAAVVGNWELRPRLPMQQTVAQLVREAASARRLATRQAKRYSVGVAPAS
jgi:hypothetical protein